MKNKPGKPKDPSHEKTDQELAKLNTSAHELASNEGHTAIDSLTDRRYQEILEEFRTSPSHRLDLMHMLISHSNHSGKLGDHEGKYILQKAFLTLAIKSAAIKARAMLDELKAKEGGHES